MDGDGAVPSEDDEAEIEPEQSLASPAEDSPARVNDSLPPQAPGLIAYQYAVAVGDGGRVL